MPRPATIPFTEAAYARLEPVAARDEDFGWPMLTFVQALAEMIRPVEELVRPLDPDREAGAPLLDVDLAPDWNLAWLAQFVGVRLSPGVTAARARVEIRSVGGFRRGTPAALLEAVRPTLTGGQYTFLQERDGDEAHMTLVTRTAETPSPTVTLSAAMRQKAAGLILTHVVTAANLYVETAAAAPTYAARSATYATYADARGF